MKTELTLQNLLDAKIAIFQGRKPTSIAKELHVAPKRLMERLDLLDKAYGSNLPALQTDKAIITASIKDRLEPIRESMAVKSVEIIEKADNLVLEALTNDEIKATDLADISEKYSKRLGRLSGIEVDPAAGNEQPKNISTKITNIFNRFLTPQQMEKIEDEVKEEKRNSEDNIIEVENIEESND